MRMITLLLLFIYTLSSQCDPTSNYNYLTLSTNLNENDDLCNVIIINQCHINEYWQIKKKSHSAIYQIFEDDTISRRLLRFYYDSKASYKLHINIILTTQEGDGKGYITDSNFELFPGDLYDTFIEYQCAKKPNNYYLKYKIDISLKEIKSNQQIASVIFPIQITKICNHYYMSTIDISHLFIVLICIGIIIACVFEGFSSKIEEKIQNKLPELRNPENLAIITVIIAIILWFFYIINIFTIWLYLSLLILVPSSIGMILEALFKGAQWKTQMSKRTLEIDFIGSLTMFHLLGLFIGMVIFLLWNISEFWLISDIIAIVFSIETIRIFKFTSFKFILFLSITLWLYDLYWFIFNSQAFNIHSRLTMQFNRNYPVLIVFPVLDGTFYSEYNALGFGDVIVPGIIINYLYRFDKKVHFNSKLYFIMSSGAYTVGLFLRVYVYCYLYLPIPAFLLVLPLIIIVVLIIAILKGDLEEIIEGFKSTVFTEDELGSRKLDQFAQDAYIFNSSEEDLAIEMKPVN